MEEGVDLGSWSTVVGEGEAAGGWSKKPRDHIPSHKHKAQRGKNEVG